MPDPGDLTLVETEGLAAGYGAAPVLTDVSFALHAGERMGVLGPNGGGKTTLLRVLLGELAPMAGTLRAPARFAVVPQTERSRLDFPVSALDVALMGSISTLPWWRRPGRAQRRAARAALAAVGLAEQANATFGDLSGGQRQRVHIAQALAWQADLLVLDEPAAALDVGGRDLLMTALERERERGAAVVMCTHDISDALTAERALLLAGRVVADGPPGEVLTREALTETFGLLIAELPGGGDLAMDPVHRHDHDHD
jgi:ABC-type Mn2+/Zn2+ transport system ATPase subunit